VLSTSSKRQKPHVEPLDTVPSLGSAGAKDEENNFLNIVRKLTEFPESIVPRNLNL
jgi:hypothetical protein